MDPIADMFSQIKNAQNIQKETLVISFSKIKMAILSILKEHHQVGDFRLKEKNHEFKKIEIDLLKDKVIDLRRISRPGRRVYTSGANIPWPKRRQAVIIISTSEGVLAGEAARKKGLGGEVIAEVR